MPYQLSCIVVEDLTARAVWTPRPSVDAAVREDVGACAVETARIGDDPLSALNDTLQAIAAGIQDIQAAAYETIAPIIATAGSIRARVQILQDTAGAALNGAAALVSISLASITLPTILLASGWSTLLMSLNMPEVRPKVITPSAIRETSRPVLPR